MTVRTDEDQVNGVAKSWLTAIGTFALLSLLAPVGLAQGDRPDGPRVWRGGEQVEVITPFVFEGDIRDLPRAPAWRPGDPVKQVPRRYYPRPGDMPDHDPARPAEQGPDPLLRLQEEAGRGGDLRAFSPPDLDFPGQGFAGLIPPDAVGDVGSDYYIQMTNASGGSVFTVYSKSDGAVVAGPTAVDQLAPGGFCANGGGDPIVLYDHLAGRWLLSEYASGGSNRLCVYISQSGDPLGGGWYVYDFQALEFPDYPKYAVWPDAYYATSNESDPAVYALERSQMLVGAPAANQRFTAPSLGGFGFQALTPGDLDGAAPPAGSPNYLMRHRDDERHDGSNDPSQDFLEIWEFSVDFADPANSTLTGPFDIAVTEFDSSLCGFTSFECFPQPDSSVLLDPLREVVMWRLQYRNLGNHEALVGNFVTDVDGSNRGGIRWFELRKSGTGSWTLFQEGTYSPDSVNRWMGSIAMDRTGNIALGYNVSSSTVFPGLRYAGRLFVDPKGTLPQGEFIVVEGSQANGSNRYGDYNSLNVDPVDGCTFWFTGEYNPSGEFWGTRIAAFGFDGCGSTCGDGIVEGNEVCDGADVGSESCVSQGCTGGGTLVCNADCTGFDKSGCVDCACDDDGTCEAGEDCQNCSNDCVSGSTAGAACGNGVCETADGENCLTCEADCNGKQNGKPSKRFCCGDGATGDGAVDCNDSRCTEPGFSCTVDPSTPVEFCCGDLICGGSESCGNCALDCTIGAEICTGGLDEDCDGFVDCDDEDCQADPACEGCTLGQQGDPCTSDADCCSSKCKGKSGQRTCK